MVQEVKGGCSKWSASAQADVIVEGHYPYLAGYGSRTSSEKFAVFRRIREIAKGDY
jgi:hypothetical protein